MKNIQFLTLSLMFATYGVYGNDEANNAASIEEFPYSLSVRAEYQFTSNMQKNMVNFPFFTPEDKECAEKAADFYQALQAAKTDAQANAIINDYSVIQATCFADQHRPERVRQREAIIKQMINEKQLQQINSIKNRYQVNDTNNN